jgi:uncharacterized hydrophobic protein (TIGR00271 family)
VLHLRLLVTPDRTDAVLELLDRHTGTANSTLIRDVGRERSSDLIEAQVAREAADDLLDRLCELGLPETGSITVLPVDLELSDAADRAEFEAPGSGTDAVVWDEVAARTGEDSELTGVFLALLIIATLLAAIGVVTDSLITVVGAMVVGPEFGPLAALAVGLVDRRWTLVRRAALALLVGFPVAMAVTAGATALALATGLADVQALDSLNRATDFIFHPGAFSLIVALLAGAVGMLSLTSGKSAALVGVFISVTTVPAAGYVAVALVSGEPQRAWGSLVQLVINLAGIAVAAAVVLVIRRMVARRLPHWRRHPETAVPPRHRHRRPPALLRPACPAARDPDRRPGS